MLLKKSKKVIFLVVLMLIAGISFSQAPQKQSAKPANNPTPLGFQPKLAKDLLAICCSFTFLDLYNSDAEIIPAGYKKTYTSGVFGMDNKYQIYKTANNTAVINIRGSTANTLSWLENIYSSMIPAIGKIVIPGDTFNYCFAKTPEASVHAGYALGIALLSKDILQNIRALNNEGIYTIVITGHSQGGALAHMLRAYLENLPANILSKSNKFSTYAFANPMVGNKEFADEYKERFSNKGTSFSVINLADFVPKMPLSYSERKLFSADNLSSLIFDWKNFNVTQTVEDAAIHHYEKSISGYVKYTGSSLEKKISSEVGQVDMPDYSDGINYDFMEARIILPPFEYPKVMKDVKALKKDSLRRVKKHLPPATEKEQYKGEPSGYQHKPYNYYVGFVKTYFPSEFTKLKKRYLPENL